MPTYFSCSCQLGRHTSKKAVTSCKASRKPIITTGKKRDEGLDTNNIIEKEPIIQQQPELNKNECIQLKNRNWRRQMNKQQQIPQAMAVITSLACEQRTVQQQYESASLNKGSLKLINRATTLQNNKMETITRIANGYAEHLRFINCSGAYTTIGQCIDQVTQYFNAVVGKKPISARFAFLEEYLQIADLKTGKSSFLRMHGINEPNVSIKGKSLALIQKQALYTQYMQLSDIQRIKKKHIPVHPIYQDSDAANPSNKNGPWTKNSYIKIPMSSQQRWQQNKEHKQRIQNRFSRLYMGVFMKVSGKEQIKIFGGQQVQYRTMELHQQMDHYKNFFDKLVDHHQRMQRLMMKQFQEGLKKHQAPPPPKPLSLQQMKYGDIHRYHYKSNYQSKFYYDETEKICVQFPLSQKKLLKVTLPPEIDPQEVVSPVTPIMMEPKPFKIGPTQQYNSKCDRDYKAAYKIINNMLSDQYNLRRNCVMKLSQLWPLCRTNHIISVDYLKKFISNHKGLFTWTSQGNLLYVQSQYNAAINNLQLDTGRQTSFSLVNIRFYPYQLPMLEQFQQAKKLQCMPRKLHKKLRSSYYVLNEYIRKCIFCRQPFKMTVDRMKCIQCLQGAHLECYAQNIYCPCENPFPLAVQNIQYRQQLPKVSANIYFQEQSGLAIRGNNQIHHQKLSQILDIFKTRSLIFAYQSKSYQNVRLVAWNDPGLANSDQKLALGIRKLRNGHIPPVQAFEVGNDNIGIRATQDIPIYELLGQYVGNIIPAFYQKHITMSSHVFGYFNGPSQMQELVIAPITCANWTCLVNHAKNPNCSTLRILVAGAPVIVFYSNKKIRKGQQLLINYNGAFNQYPVESFQSYT